MTLESVGDFVVDWQLQVESSDRNTMSPFPVEDIGVPVEPAMATSARRVLVLDDHALTSPLGSPTHSARRQAVDRVRF